ncbi:MAG: hypothetical protein KDB37_01405 [Ilumatobacter sp.]|nr:hypothetical protein [Ilumatobacter sp.]
MTLIRVNPASVRAYGATAQGEFDAITAELGRLADDVVAVRYFGPNAVQFKTECGRLAEEFGRSLHRSMGAMADAVRVSTSNIAASLGGAPLDITLADKPIAAPAPAVVDYVDVDTAALEALMPVVDAHFAAIREAMQRHLGALQRTDWEGNAKQNAVGAVQALTGNATSTCDEARAQLTGFIRTQIDSVVLADV